MAPIEELTAVFRGERRVFDNTDGSRVVIADAVRIVETTGECREDITLKGPADVDDLLPHLSYRFFGRFAEYANKWSGKAELQFHFQTFFRCQPHGRAGIVAYLQKAGAGRGIGRATAAKLFDKFGGDAVRILREQPEIAAAAVPGLSLENAREAAKWLTREAAMENTKIALHELLAGRHFRRALIKDVLTLWGAEAPAIIQRDPFRLMRFNGCGFKRCDAFYLDLGLPPNKLKRQALAAIHAIENDTDGHTWLPEEFGIRAVQRQIGGPAVQPGRAIALAIRAQRLAWEDREKMRWIALRAAAAAERMIAEKITSLLQSPPRWDELARSVQHVSDHQRTAIESATRATVGLFVGGPGTGKSFSTAQFVAALLGQFGVDEIGIAAPTNKAAVRLRSVLSQYQLPPIAKSIHSLLGVAGVDNGVWKFEHNAANALPYKVVLIDESSMVSTELMAALLSACAAGTHVLFIGDPNQLPPIQHGAPLRDFLAAGLPCGALSEPQRNAGDIVLACDDIRRGKPFRASERIDLECLPPKNFRFLPAGSPSQQIDKLLAALEVAEKLGYDPTWDCQVMVAVNESSPVGRKQLNAILQRELNSGGAGPQSSPFRVGDKVVCEKNGRYRLATGIAEEYVAKGEFGRVVQSADREVAVRFADPDRAVIFHRVPVSPKERPQEGDEPASDDDSAASETGCDLQLAYAATVHKMQGSECPIALPVIDESHGARRLGSREWFFTAISRGKKLTLPVGSIDTAQQMCRRVVLGRRKTFLAERLKGDGRWS